MCPSSQPLPVLKMMMMRTPARVHVSCVGQKADASPGAQSLCLSAKAPRSFCFLSPPFPFSSPLVSSLLRLCCRHHLIPKLVHNAYRRKGLTRAELAQTTAICRPCHNAVHRAEPHAVLAARSAWHGCCPCFSPLPLCSHSLTHTHAHTHTHAQTSCTHTESQYVPSACPFNHPFQRYNTVEKLGEHPEIAKWVRFAASKRKSGRWDHAMMVSHQRFSQTKQLLK